nr:MAG TPA: hypothetical protein [Caudoviricetes sp.]
MQYIRNVVSVVVEHLKRFVCVKSRNVPYGITDWRKINFFRLFFICC